MWAVSQRFLDSLRGAPLMRTVVDVYDQGTIVLGDIPVHDGQVIRDRKAQQYGRCSLTVATKELAPLGPADELGPAGFEIAPKRGPVFPDGTFEPVPLGFFGIQESTVEGESLTTQIEATDRSQRVADARLEDDANPAAGVDQTITAALIIQGALPDTVFASTGPSDNTPAGIVYAAQSDRWEIVQKIAKAIGYEIFFDGLGRCVMRPEPDLTTADPVWDVDEGPGGVLVSASMAWSRRPSYNRAYVTGTNAEFGITYRGVATDDAPASPSYYSGRFGPKPYFFEDPNVASTAQATKAAKAILAARQGIAKSLDFSAVPNPALEPGDVVTVRRAALGLDTAMIIDAITLGLAPEAAMTCEVRARQEDEIT